MFSIKTTLLLASFVLISLDLGGLIPRHPDMFKTLPQLCRKYGYPVEKYKITTKDGYILTIHRIPHGRNGRRYGPHRKRPVVFLQHGLLGASDSWIMNTRHKNLAYILADAGYDVWLNNARGNRYSKDHVSLSPRKSKFWKFSWHEMGKYDIPAAIDFVLSKTRERDLYYIGHSMGTTMFWVAMSLRPRYNSKIKLMIALAPVAFMTRMKSPIRLLAPFCAGGITTTFLETLSHGVPLGEYQPHRRHRALFKSYACSTDETALLICGNSYFVQMGYDIPQLNLTQLPVYLGHFPAGSSVYTMLHYAQLINSGGFRRYDYGMIRNWVKYGKFLPPSYNLSRVRAKVIFMWGTNDWLADERDVRKLSRRLPNLIGSYRVNYSTFNHIDFMIAKDNVPLVYRPLLKILREQ